MTTNESDLIRRTRIPPRGSYTGVPSLEIEDAERHEKPWQQVPSWYMPLVLALFLLLGFLVQCHEDSMPAVVLKKDVPQDSWDTFSEESALEYLQQLLGAEPRVAGTRHHLRKTRDLKQLVDDIAARARQRVRTDWQMASGDYWLEFKVPFVNSYSNVSNVAALLEGEGGEGAPALLLNCHYDSVPYALGAGDNGVFCAAMLEVLARLSRRPAALRHNVVFLFNGAEENPLQGSHAFLAHRWARAAVAVVNMDAAGMNGHPSVFQVSERRVLAAYGRAARRPSAQALGELLFASGLVPSDTDYRVWRDFGRLRGVDMAFTKWGVVYHTRHDTARWLRAGVLQAAGDTLLRLAAELAGDARLAAQEPEPEPLVYFDYLGVWLVVWGAGAARAAEGGAALAGLLSVAYYVRHVGCRLSTLRELCIAVAARLAAALAGVAALALVTALMIATTTQLRYLSEPWLVVPLYWLPCLLAAAAAARALDAWRANKSGLSRSVRSLQAMAATRLLLSGALLLLCCVPAAAAARYALAVPLLLAAAAGALGVAAARGGRPAGQRLALALAAALPAVSWLLALALRLLALLLPTLGRLPLAAPDAVAAAVCGALALLVAAPLSGVELLFSRRRQWAPLGALAALCAACMLLPLAPYRDAGPATQRHHWFHAEVVRHDASGAVTSRTYGVLVTPQDAYSVQRARAELRAAGLALRTRAVRAADCRRDALCGLPVYRLRGLTALSNSMWILTGPPAPLQPPPALRVTSRRCDDDTHTCTLAFTMQGPAHNTLTVSPHRNVSLVRWSFAAAARPTLTHDGRPLYVVVHSVATYAPAFEPLQFNITFDVSRRAAGAPLADVSQHAHLAAHPERHTAEYGALLAAAPPYFNIASYSSYRHDYIV